jgi:hypothetical protein
VECMEDGLKLKFRTERPFKGRIFVKGMIDNDKCVNNYVENSDPKIQFEIHNGECNMRRSRKVCRNFKTKFHFSSFFCSWPKIFSTIFNKFLEISFFALH